MVVTRRDVVQMPGTCVVPPSEPPPVPAAGQPAPAGEPADPVALRQPTGEAIAVAFDPRGNVVVQTREPATLQVLTQAGSTVILASESRADEGHALFHGSSPAGLACASCHPEGGEDGRVWTFAKIGARRTQSLRGGILSTAPFHWDGDMRDVGHLVQEVFVGRMAGTPPTPRQVDALATWLDGIRPLFAPAPRDFAAAERGREIFHSPVVACTACHSGPKLTNNARLDVGTGGAFQVPSLRGVSFRAPYMHDGCAKTLADRFTTRCGGEDNRHGVVSSLSAGQIADLVAYLETL